jgi:hypothetical protein
MRSFASLTCALIIGFLPISSFALRFNINAGTPFVFIQIGYGTLSTYGLFGPAGPGQNEEVSFAFPIGVLPGDGTPVVGTPVIPIAVIGHNGRRGRGGGSRYIVTMNSSMPLVSGSGDTMPFSEFSWTTQDGDIPGGTFVPGATQTLVTMNRGGRKARGLVDYFTFTYANTSVYASGTYSGKVFYTIALL